MNSWAQRSSRLWTPHQAFSVAYLDARYDITIGTTPKAFGTTPPVLTFAGVRTGMKFPYIQCDGAGALGVWTYKVSYNDGVSFPHTGILSSGSATALPGIGSAITVAAAAGNAATDNIWKSTVETWADARSGKSVTQATASKQPLYLTAGGSNGQPCLSCDGTDDFLSTTFTFNQPNHVTFVGKWGGSGTGTMICGADNIMRIWRASATQINYFSGAQIVVGSVTPDSWHVHDVLFSGASSFFFQDGVSKDTSNAGTGGASGLTLGSLNDGSQSALCTISQVGIASRALTTAERNRATSYLGSLNGISVTLI